MPDQLYPLLPIKTWTSRHISPYAWDRAIIRSLPALQRIQAHLPSLLAPRSDTQVPGKAIEVILNSLKDMYGISINPEEVLQRTVL
ncbi:MAG: hypothetical protein N3E49_04200 [Bacteroidia bacterium]|nr:hypothetical protein [Bacteroidia bacterium]